MTVWLRIPRSADIALLLQKVCAPDDGVVHKPRLVHVDALQELALVADSTLHHGDLAHVLDDLRRQRVE
jgi:hypothetical protein